MVPQAKTIVIRHRHSVRETSSGNRYLVCDTDLGRIAFWGKSDNVGNIRKVESLSLPARVRVGCIESKWSQHDFWVPESAAVLMIPPTAAEDGTEAGRRPPPGAERPSGNNPAGSAADSPQAGEQRLDPHAVRGVSKGASAAEIHAAYLMQMKQYHPDQVAHLGAELQELAHKKAQQINRAYGALRNRR